MNCETCAHFKACKRLIDARYDELVPCEGYQPLYTVDAVPVVHGLHCIDIVDFIDWLDVGYLRSADEKCFSEANVAGMLKDFAITNPAIHDSVTRCKDCRYGLPCKLFGRDAITCTEHREEIHPMDWYCADAAKTDGKDDAR